MSETVNCKDCGILVWSTDIPSKKTGFCWRCEIKRLKGVNRVLDEANANLRESIAVVSRDLERHRSALFKTIARLRIILFYFSSTKVEAAVACWLEWKEGGIDLLNPPPKVDELLQKLEAPDQCKI